MQVCLIFWRNLKCVVCNGFCKDNQGMQDKKSGNNSIHFIRVAFAMSEAKRSKSSQGKKNKTKPKPQPSSSDKDKSFAPSPLYADPASFKSPDPESIPKPKFLAKLITVGDSWTLAEKRIEVKDLLLGSTKTATPATEPHPGFQFISPAKLKPL